MNPVEALRDFINVRLTAAAGEIYTVFDKYRQEIDTQPRLLDIKEQIRDDTQQHLWKDEQQKHSSLGLEQPEPPQIKADQMQLEVKQEPEIIMVTVTGETSENGENLDSHDSVREFINVQLTAAAGEIFSEFQQAIVRYQEEIQTHRRLLGVSLKPQMERHGIDVPEHRVCKEEQLWNQDMNSSLDQKEPEAPQIKEDPEEPKPTQIKEGQEELCTSQDGEQLLLKQEVDTVMSVPPGEPSELQPGEALYSCVTCGKKFSLQSSLLAHMRIHTSEKPYSCETCGKSFSFESNLLVHYRTHFGENSYSCETCGKRFTLQTSLSIHMRTHTGEKPYSCGTCGKSFTRQSCLSVHIRTHTGEKPYSCETCGKSFSQKGHLLAHNKSHNNQKSYFYKSYCYKSK